MATIQNASDTGLAHESAQEPDQDRAQQNQQNQDIGSGQSCHLCAIERRSGGVRGRRILP